MRSQWDPTTQKHLALALRGNGVALWEWGSQGGMQMWSGMSFQKSRRSFSGKQKEFDPLFAKWSRAGMLVLGMADGSFSVFDSVSQHVLATACPPSARAPSPHRASPALRRCSSPSAPASTRLA